MPKTTVDDLAAELDKILKEYGDDASEAVMEEITSVSKEAAKQVKANANSMFKKGKGSKHYANGWRCKIVKGKVGIQSIVYNANKPQLTHLLENGHAKANGVGRVSGKPHIAPVNEWAEKEVMQRIEKRLSE